MCVLLGGRARQGSGTAHALASVAATCSALQGRSTPAAQQRVTRSCTARAPPPWLHPGSAKPHQHNTRTLLHRYALNVWFNLLNKSIFKYFPFPYTVSTVHVVVGTAYCALVYVMGLKSWSFGRVSGARRGASAALSALHRHRGWRACCSCTAAAPAASQP